MKTYEIELRALISEDKYHELKKHFDSLAKGEQDDADTFTFLNKDINIKVKNLISQGKAKITVKNGAEYRQQTDENELPIDPQNVEKAVALITALGYQKHIPSHQNRINYVIDDITISLKHETYWKYHIEAEIVVNKEEDMQAAHKRLVLFFKDLDITPMTEEENKALVNTVLKRFDMDLL